MDLLLPGPERRRQLLVKFLQYAAVQEWLLHAYLPAAGWL